MVVDVDFAGHTKRRMRFSGVSAGNDEAGAVRV